MFSALSDLKPTPVSIFFHVVEKKKTNQLLKRFSSVKRVWGPWLLEVFRAKYFGANSFFPFSLARRGDCACSLPRRRAAVSHQGRG